MDLTLEQAAARLGKTPRQVRYLIKTERLPATKFGGRWLIRSEDLQLSAGQEAAAESKQRRLRAAVDEALGLPEERPPRFSVRDLKAFKIAGPLHARAEEELGADHPATAALRRVLELLCQGCHRYERAAKAEAYAAARDAASLAVCELVLICSETADELITELEQELMAAFAGLLRRLDRRGRGRAR